jgi:hypothetical protein
LDSRTSTFGATTAGDDPAPRISSRRRGRAAFVWHDGPRGRAGPGGNVWSWHGGESVILARQQTAPPIELGRSYNMKARVETLQGPKTRYSVKRWPTNQAEPTDWDLVAIDGPQDTQSGSLLFVVHHSDVTIGNISILPLSAAPGRRDRNQ